MGDPVAELLEREFGDDRPLTRLLGESMSWPATSYDCGKADRQPYAEPRLGESLPSQELRSGYRRSAVFPILGRTRSTSLSPKKQKARVAGIFRTQKNPPERAVYDAEGPQGRKDHIIGFKIPFSAPKCNLTSDVSIWRCAARTQSARSMPSTHSSIVE